MAVSAQKIDYVNDWKTRLRSRIYWQFRNATKALAELDADAVQFQQLEDATQSLLTLISIPDSVGAQLDAIGRLVGQPRSGVDDATYRLYLSTRIVANRSEGTPESLYRVFSALLGAVLLIYIPGGNKSFVLRVRTPITSIQAVVARTFLNQAEEAGARGILEWQQAADAALFRFDTGPGFDVGVFADAMEG